MTIMDHLLNQLSSKKLSLAYKRRLLSRAPRKLIKLFSEIALNIILGNYKIPRNKLRKLRFHRAKVERLAKSERYVSKRRYLTNQKGGFLNLLIPILAGAATALLR